MSHYCYIRGFLQAQHTVTGWFHLTATEMVHHSTYVKGNLYRDTFLVENFSTPNFPTLYTCNSYIIAWISNSKAAKGLLVYLEVNSICTAIPISLSQSSRQLLYRYIIHARPHLTARVFRYLRTLIGKAAVYRGFHQSLTF